MYIVCNKGGGVALWVGYFYLNVLKTIIKYHAGVPGVSTSDLCAFVADVLPVR